MPLPDTWSRKRPPVKTETRTFASGDFSVDLTFRSLCTLPLVAMDAAAAAREALKAHEAGFPRPDGTGRVPLNWDACYFICLFLEMQVGPDGNALPPEEMYSFSQWVGMLDNLPNLYLQIRDWASALNADKEEGEEEGNAPAASAITTPPSAPS